MEAIQNSSIYRQTVFFTLVLWTVLGSSGLSAQNGKEDGKDFPVPSGNTNQLFYLQRNENTNTVIYELNEQNDVLNTESPIHIFWIMYTKGKQHEELSGMEKKYAYGIKIKSSGKEQYQFTLIAYPKASLQLSKGSDQRYHVYITPTKQQMILHKTFIKLKESSLKLKPVVEYIEFSGISVATGKEIIERITP